MSLRAKTAKGFVLESMKIATTSVISIIRMMILARLLAPNAFGLFALALALINGLETVTNVNVEKYLIQRKEIEPELVGCAWLMGIGQVVRCQLSVVCE